MFIIFNCLAKTQNSVYNSKVLKFIAIKTLLLKLSCQLYKAIPLFVVQS